MSKTTDAYARAKRRIPGGTQLLSKRPEMFLPGGWPGHYSRAAGALVWDLDGKEYLDMTICAIGACPLGFADPDVNAAVETVIEAGSMATLNPPEEIELAERLCDLHPWAEMARFARSGGEAMTIAVRIARAATGRERVAFCGYHGWHDWYLSSNLASESNLAGHLLPGLEPAGVPAALTGTALPFSYNGFEELDAVVAAHGQHLAAIVMEPRRFSEPAPGFLEHVRSRARRAGAVLIFDEITSAWRTGSGGAHLELGVEPDIAVFAKGMSNGYPMAAVLGVSNVMEAAQSSFISSTYWTERIGPAAALATIDKFERKGVAGHLVAIGTRIQRGWRELAARHGLPVTVRGVPPLSSFSFDLGEQARAASTLFTQAMLDRGLLASPGFYAMYAHQDAHVDRYLEAADAAFSQVRAAHDEGDVTARLRGGVAHSGFRRLA